jgi:hypothetical protein
LQEADAVAAAEAVGSCARRQRGGEFAGGRVFAAQRVDYDLCHGRGVFPGAEQVGGGPQGPGHQEAALAGPLAVVQGAHVDPHVRAAGLAPGRDGELVLVGREVPQPVQCRCRAVRDHALLRGPFPGAQRGGELEPGAPQVPVIGNGRPGQLVHAPRHSFQHAGGRGEALDGR